MRELSVHVEQWRLVQPFRISRHVWETSNPVVVEIADGEHVGRGEASGLYYLDETSESMLEQIDRVAPHIRAGASREELLELLPHGGARNAVDCALWDLEAKKAGRTIWELTGITPKPLTTVFTIGIEADAEVMGQRAAEAKEHPALKIKLSADTPLERMQAVRAARPDAALVVDANQAWSFAELQRLAPRFAELGVSMIEQPLPRGEDEALAGYQSPVPLCADESCLHTGELDAASARYQMINIKLDKSGGLTEALRLARKAEERGLGLMVGNMVGTSLAMAPSFVIGQLCQFIDLDGPLLLREDRALGMRYERGTVHVPNPALWG